MKSLVLLLVAVVGASALRREDFRPIEEKFLKAPEQYPLYAMMAAKRGGASRIVGGQETAPGQIPHQLGLFINAILGNYFCGGALINEFWALSAAHCLDDVNLGVDLICGAHNILLEEPDQRNYFISPDNVHVHEDWDRSIAYNDLALLHIGGNGVQLTGRIQLINLPPPESAEEDFNGEVARASGWGVFSDLDPSAASTLRFVDMSVMRNVECRGTYGSTIKNEHVCLDGEGGRGICSGKFTK